MKFMLKGKNFKGNDWLKMVNMMSHHATLATNIKIVNH